MRLVIRGDSFIEMDRYNCSEKGDQALDSHASTINLSAYDVVCRGDT